MDPIRTPRTIGVYGAPPGHEDAIGGLPYWREPNEFGGNTIYSVWAFTDGERRAIAKGANLVLGILGEPIPPVSLSLRQAEGDFALILDDQPDSRPPKSPAPPADREMG